ncbi:MAG: aminofutalosine synthase MqnE [Chloroflexi bacterium]|mgnify:FL=1|jgi:aminodeoxyfutalosine synthase|nr:aminofutalosine synthase MqnE [Chloroflexota bacterium]MBT3862109.1 aminofutalosine synthase MqnE [Chloroflexota bacterium]MBT4142294.1 aminofutalosine synthase MqnE [Chloroflexota bacterium]MBT4341352.1 aminofutalosine synthase MqnE [Chloroflexota bacterium]MBT4942432.1 aminofutalosine synthase MqnE [Chloroflexota bacterium]
MVPILEVADPNLKVELNLSDKRLFSIWDKVQAGERLSSSEGVTLLDTDDLPGVGRMADFAKKRVTGDKVYFVLNRHVNPTNICVLSCKFCDFAKKPGEKDAYEMSIDEILDHVDDDIHEIHIVGGHHPTWPFEYYVEMVKAIKEKAPHVQIKGFTASEIDYFQRRWKVSPEESLAILKEAGLQSMPGGGAEVFSSRVHKILLPGKANADRWAEIHKTAHRMDIPTNCTLLYGHIESFEERIEHLIRLRNIQDETGGFLAFIPLEYQVGMTKLRPRHTPAMDDLKMIAAARLMLDNIKYIKSYWVMLGAATASIGLNFGANDLDGTIGKERIAHAALAESPAGQARESMASSIRDARRIPVERDALYNEIKVYDH